MSRVSLVEGVLGIADIHSAGLAMQQAHVTLTGEPFNPYERAHNGPRIPALRNAWWNSLTQNERERSWVVRDVADLVVRHEVHSASTLADWPLYQGMMRAHGTKADGSAKALMVGSLTSLSSRSFVCLAREEYGANEAFIVDPKGGRDKARHGHLVFASGLELPFPDESMDFVHTNQLIHMLVDPSSPSSSQTARVRRLIREIVRVTAPGGQILLKEMIPNHRKYEDGSSTSVRAALSETERLARYVGGAMSKDGVGYVRAEPATQMLEDGYLFDRQRDFSRYKTGVNALAFTIFAQKQPQLSPIML